jgi:hypothetical protein
VWVGPSFGMTLVFVFGAVWAGPVPYDGVAARVAALSTAATAVLHGEPGGLASLQEWLGGLSAHLVTPR